MCDGRDTSVGVDLEEPRGLDLVVDLADVGVADAQLHGAVRECRSARRSEGALV